MSNCPGCDSSSTTYSRCNPPVSTNCVFYQGDSKVCPHDDTFTICKGDNLSAQQLSIFNKICSLIGNIDITTIQIPTCFYESWNAENPTQQDKTLLNLLEYMLDIQCQQKQLIESIDPYVNNRTILDGNIKTIDPYVHVCLSCCTPSGQCGTPVILLSQALTAIVECVCKARTEAANALAKANDAWSKADAAMNNYETLLKKQCQQSIQLTTIITYLNKPVDQGGLNAGLSFDLTPCN